MIRYEKLFILMKSKGLYKNDLRKGILSPSTISKLTKNENIESSVFNKLCKFLDCQPGDIMEYVPDQEEQESSED